VDEETCLAKRELYALALKRFKDFKSFQETRDMPNQEKDNGLFFINKSDDLRPQSRLIWLRPGLEHFLSEVVTLFDPCIVTAAQESHAECFLTAFDNKLGPSNHYGKFFRRRGRLFWGRNQKALENTSCTSIFSTVIVDDMHNLYGTHNNVWVESDRPNVWRVKSWTPLLKDLDYDTELVKLVGDPASIAGASPTARARSGVLQSVHKKFFNQLKECADRMREDMQWYDAEIHEVGRRCQPKPVRWLLDMERDTYNQGGMASPNRSRSRSPSPTRAVDASQIFWLGADSSALREMARQSPDRGTTRPLKDLEFMYLKAKKFIKIFVPAKTMSELDNQAHSQNKDEREEAKSVINFITTYSHKGWLVKEDEFDESRRIGPHSKPSNDRRIVKSMENLAMKGYPYMHQSTSVNRIDPCGMTRVALLTNDETQSNTCRDENVRYFTVARLQRFLYNLSQDSCTSRQSIPEVAAHLRNAPGDQHALARKFWDHGPRGGGVHWGIATKEDLPQLADNMDWVQFPVSTWNMLDKWLEKLNKEGAFGQR